MRRLHAFSSLTATVLDADRLNAAQGGLGLFDKKTVKVNGTSDTKGTATDDSTVDIFDNGNTNSDRRYFHGLSPTQVDEYETVLGKSHDRPPPPGKKG